MNTFDIKSMIFFIIISIIIVASSYIKRTLESTNFEEILFYSLYVKTIVSDGLDPFIYAIKKCLPFVFLLIGLFYLLFFGINSNFYLLTFIREYKTIIIIILLILSIINFLNNVGILSYLYYYLQKSTIIDDNYIDPKKVNVNFKKKNNLILIFVESLENSLLSKDNGGVWNYQVISELEELLKDKDTTNFFDNKNNSGMHMLTGSSYTSSSNFANNSGLPIKMNLNRKGYAHKKYLPGTYPLGELLEKNGYYNEIISTASTDYGGFKDFYTEHGNYTVIDNDNLSDYKINIPDNYKGEWGINDMGLFEVAKKRLDVITKKKKPFNLQLITIDTHFFDGYIYEYSETKYAKRYENVYATTSRLINDFINYVKAQPYYKDTTIVIVGDHQIMQSTFVNDKMCNNRTIYNIFINSVKKNHKKRSYTPLDLYPTIISALGGEIKGNKIALGVDLFQEDKTLIEKYGYKKLNKELRKRSKFYDKEILHIKK